MPPEQNVMQVSKIILRVIKMLGKVLLGLVLLLLVIAGLLHLPSVQKQLTHTVSNYLSDKVKTRVEIDRIKFSISGDVSLQKLAVWDPQNDKILSVHEIEVTTDIRDLISGNLIFNEIRIAGLEGKLAQDESGLNISFILDAFASTTPKDSTQSKPINLQFKKIRLENILFEFSSTTNGLSVKTNLNLLETTDAALLTNPLKISANQILLQRTIVDVLASQHTNTQHTTATSPNKKILSPDFGTGIVFEIKNLVFKEDDFSFHIDEVRETEKFDPAHLSLTNIQLNLADILIHKDTLTVNLQSLSTQLPGFELTDAQMVLQSNKDQLAISGFYFTSGINKLQASLISPLDLPSIKDEVHAPLSVNVNGEIKPSDFSYFLSESVMKQFNGWALTKIELNANYQGTEATINTLNLETGNSQLHATGIIQQVMNPENISWKNLSVNTLLGSDFKILLTPYLNKINLPPFLTLQVTSTGNIKSAAVDAKVLSPWGNAKVIGLAGRQTGNVDIDLKLTGEKVNVGAWLNQAWIGNIDLSADAKGVIGNKQNLLVNGQINEVEIQQQLIRDIAFESEIKKDSATLAVLIKDPAYQSAITSDILFNDTLMLTNHIQIDSFLLGKLLHADSTLTISGDTRSKVIISPSSLEGFVEGKNLIFHKKENQFVLDTLSIQTLLSPSKSNFTYLSDYAKINLTSNFDLRESPELIKAWSENILKDSADISNRIEARTARFNIELGNASALKLLDIDIDEFTSLNITGNYDENKQMTSVHATSGNFKGYGISMDTLHSEVFSHPDTIRSNTFVKNLVYNSIGLGNLDLDVVKRRDTTRTNILLSTDTSTLLGLNVRVVRIDSGTWVYPDKLKAFDNDYQISSHKPIFFGKDNMIFDHFKVNRDSMQINVNGDLNDFEVTLKNLDLTPLNLFLSPDTMLINKGNLSGNISYHQNKQLNLDAHIDSLSLYNSNPLKITANAESKGSQVPFEFLVTSTSNKIDLKGNYFTDDRMVDAALLLDVNDSKIFEFLLADVFDEMHGSVKGKTTIRGPIQKPQFKGSIHFIDVGLTTANPRLTFNITDDSIALENTSLLFNKFTLFDKDSHPLSIDGNITLKEYQSLTYDLQINSDEFTLINNPDSTSGKLRGLFVIDSDVKLRGDQKDTNIEARLKINNATNLTLVNSKSDIQLLTAEGVIDFVDPDVLSDTTSLEVSTNFYDSLIASLPDFNLNAKISIEENASFRLIIDEQSGDYIKASGAADLELGYDRTGNLRLDGNYTIKNGVYRLSFYDLVKKNFNLMQGSSITWHGSPKNGDLSIKAQHTVESNSLGLIGNEVGENEKSIYKRSLDYQVGININGTIEKPLISFSLDLPQTEKVNYPVLSNKLDRLKQPEYQSELNKQVFGLLVLGGFLPESSGSDINSSLVATTALSNSVNSLLASQLNRFTSQYIKGVNIDVGIQSFSDYSAPGGKTQTAMDFRVSKKMMNDRLSFEIGGDFDISQDQSGANKGNNYRGDIAIIYDLTGNGDKQLKLFNNETYDIIYQEIRNTGICLILIREFASMEEKRKKDKNK